MPSRALVVRKKRSQCRRTHARRGRSGSSPPAARSRGRGPSIKGSSGRVNRRHSSHPLATQPVSALEVNAPSRRSDRLAAHASSWATQQSRATTRSANIESQPAAGPRPQAGSDVNPPSATTVTQRRHSGHRIRLLARFGALLLTPIRDPPLRYASAIAIDGQRSPDRPSRRDCNAT